MPVYEYSCTKCGELFELFVRHASDTTTCPKCGSTETERLISATNIGSASQSGAGHSCASHSGFS